MQSTDSRQTAEALAASYRLLEIANRHTRMTPLLEAFVVEVKSLTGCEAVGIRILQENGSIPYESYDGFKQEFYDLENHLSIWFDRCACINIVKGDVDPQLPFYTPEGSFYINRLDEFFCKLSPEEQGMFRGNCHKFGYESMALVPIRLGGQILGMIHAADPRKDIMPLAMVELLEKVGLQLGPAIHRIKVEEECRRAENALRGQQEELEIILDSVPAMIFYKDKENRFIRVNKALASAMGLPKEEINGKSVYELLPSHANEYWKDDLEVMSSGNPKHNIVEPLETPEGMRWVQTDKIPYRDKQGNIIGVIGFAVDVTEHKQAEEALKRQYAILTGINRIFQEALTFETEEQLGETCLTVAEELTGSRFGFIGELNQEGKLDDLAISYLGWEVCKVPGTEKLVVPKNFHVHGIYGVCLREGRSEIANDPANHPDSIGVPEGHPSITAFLGVPLKYAGKTIGLIGLGNKEGGYKEADREAVEALAVAVVAAFTRLRAEKEIQRLASFPQLNPNPVLELDLEGRITFYNQAALKALGETGTAADLGKFLPGDLQEILSKFKETGEEHFHQEVVVNGTVFLVSISLVEQLNLVRLYAIDITQRKRAEKALKERTAELEFANRELESFTYSVSHDLKAPVRAIEGFSRMLEVEHADRLDAEGLRLLKVVIDNTKLMHHLIDDLMALSRLGRMAIRKGSVDLTGMARLIFDRLREQAPDRDLRVTIGDLPPGRGDQSLLYQVMENLLNNAIKYTRSRKIAVIEVGCRDAENETIYFIKDNGVGFDERYAEKLFGVFKRLHKREEYEGTGVGLAIVKRIIERHGGHVWSEGKVDEGATFYFALPKAKE